MKESDVQAAMDATPKVAADGLWYDEASTISETVWNALGQKWRESPDPARCGVSGALLPPPNMQCPPEIPVTAEMIAAGRDAAAKVGSEHYISLFVLTPIYRAMAVLAPKNTASKWWAAQWQEGQARIAALEAENAALSGRVDELQSYSHEMAKEIDRRNNLDQQSEAYQYLKRLFLHVAPQCCVLPDLLGVCTQVDNAIAGLKIDLAALEAENVQRLAERNNLAEIAIDQANRINTLTSQLARFTGASVPTDLPDPSRRPDGTLVPASKPWTPPKDTGDKRRIGG